MNSFLFSLQTIHTMNHVGSVYILVCLVCTTPVVLTSNVHTYIHFIKDFFDASDYMKVITALLCWKHENLKVLRRMLPFTMLRTPSLNQAWYNTETSMGLRHQELFILDTSCAEAPDVLSMADKHELLRSPYSWLLLSNTTNDNIVMTLKNFAVFPDSNVVISEIKDDTFTLYQVFKPSLAHNDLIHEPYGNWTADQGIADVRTSKINSRRRRDLRGTKITHSLVITSNDSINHLYGYKDEHIDTITKLSFKLINHLTDIVNATKGYTHVPSWGYKDPTAIGGWNGMLGELKRQEVEIGTPLFLTKDRLPVIDYITMCSPTSVRFVFRAPPLSYVSNLYLLPFSRSVWMACGGLVLAMTVALTVFARDSQTVTGNFIAMSDSLLLSLGAVCQQGAPATPHNIAGRIVTLMLFISVMFLYTSYTANIVSLLQARTYSIRTLADLLKSPMELGVADIVYNHHYFSTATEPVRKAIYEKKVAPKGKKPRFFNVTYGVHRMRQGLFAFHMECGPGYKIVSETFYEHEKCGLIEVDYLSFKDPWLPIRKLSPYKEIFKVNMFKMRESGIQAREVSRHYTKKPSCTTGGASFVSVGLADCYSGVFVLSVGSAFAILFLTMEITYRRIVLLGSKKWAISVNEDVINDDASDENID